MDIFDVQVVEDLYISSFGDPNTYYRRDHKGVGVAHRITSPKNQPQFSQTIVRYGRGQ